MTWKKIGKERTREQKWEMINKIRKAIEDHDLPILFFEDIMINKNWLYCSYERFSVSYNKLKLILDRIEELTGVKYD